MSKESLSSLKMEGEEGERQDLKNLVSQRSPITCVFAWKNYHFFVSFYPAW